MCGEVKEFIVKCPAWEPTTHISATEDAKVKVPELSAVSREIRRCPNFIPVYNPRDY